MDISDARTPDGPMYWGFELEVIPMDSEMEFPGAGFPSSELFLRKSGFARPDKYRTQVSPSSQLLKSFHMRKQLKSGGNSDEYCKELVIVWLTESTVLGHSTYLTV